MSFNREYKDTLFSLLFNNEDAMRELFNALTGSNYGPETPVTITTLQDVFYQGVKNDVSFLMAHIVMIVMEHQSTANPNMPIRFMMYVGRLYQDRIDNRDFHKSRQVKLARPLLAVLFNGKLDVKEDVWELKLSDAFLGEAPAGAPFGSMEVTVKVYNINPGHNEGLLARSPTLRGYMAFVNELRSREAVPGKSHEEAVLETIDACIERGHLVEFLKKHRIEVKNMTLSELTIDDALEAVREETWEEAEKKTREETEKRTQANTMDRIFSLLGQGYSEEAIRQMARTNDPLYVGA